MFASRVANTFQRVHSAIIRNPSIATRALRTSAPCRNNENTAKRIESEKSTSDLERRKQECAQIVEQVRIMNEYFNQYVDEYYEEEEELIVEEKSDLPTTEEKLLNLEKMYEKRLSLPSVSNIVVEDIIELIRQLRVKNIVCLCMGKDAPSEYVVICEAHNKRHGNAVITSVRKYLKDNYRFPNNNTLPKRVPSGNAPEWFNMDLRKISLNILTEKARSWYDLETLYGIDDGFGETYNDIVHPTTYGMSLGRHSEFLPPPQQATM